MYCSKIALKTVLNNWFTKNLIIIEDLFGLNTWQLFPELLKLCLSPLFAVELFFLDIAS